MAMKFAKPAHSAAVKGDQTVGKVARAEDTYCTEAYTDDCSAYAEAATPADARRLAARRLWLKLAK